MLNSVYPTTVEKQHCTFWAFFMLPEFTKTQKIDKQTQDFAMLRFDAGQPLSVKER